MMMRVFKRVDEEHGPILEVWEKGDCLPCPCRNRGNCNQCDDGCLPPINKSPLLWKHFILKPSVEIEGIYAGDYRYYAHGTYNLVYRSRDQRWVLKFPIDLSEVTDLPERAVRVWNTINPGFPAQVICDLRGAPIAWAAPFIHGIQPTHEEIAQKVLEIYEKTGRIVADAFVTSNFVKTANGIVCIDVGAAFFLESRSGLARIHSQVSLDTWNNGDAENNIKPMSNIYRAEFPKNEVLCRIIVHVTKALLYLQMHRPDFRSVSDMLRQGSLIDLLALNYDKNPRRSEQVPEIIDQYIDSCVHVKPQSASAAAAKSSDDRASETNSDADIQNQDEQQAVAPGNRLPDPAGQLCYMPVELPAAWLGQNLASQYNPRFFLHHAMVVNQPGALPRIDDML